jgi:ATP-dependent Clp protease adaptor protein ClpS
MSATVDPEVTPVTLPAPLVRPEPEPNEQTHPKRQPPYGVVLHNDDINSFDHVIGVLRKVFHYGFAWAFWLTLKTHVSGQCIVWSGSLELAELKAEQIRSCGPDPRATQRGAQPLRVTVEALPGDGS